MKLLRAVLVFALLCLAVSPGAAYMITEFCADGYAAGDGDEYFVLEGEGSLASWSVTDGEGTVSLPDADGPSSREVLSSIIRFTRPIRILKSSTACRRCRK